LLDAIARSRELVGYWSVGKKDFGQAEGGKLVETFLNRNVEVTPALGRAML
jgi:hypothetical protein